MRIDIHPTDTFGEFQLRPGLIMTNGAHLVPGGVNFSIYSSGASSCELILYYNGEKDPFAIIPFPESYRIGAVFSMIVFNLDYEDLEYGFRMDGEYDFSRGLIFDKTKTLLDPYAEIITGRDVWGKAPDLSKPFQYRGKVALNDFDWEGDSPIRATHNEMIIYEAHVRGFTVDKTSGVKYKGTFAGFREKIPYLKDLGVNTVELLPIFEFDEFEGAKEGEAPKVANYWGYNTVGFFAPKAGYAASGKYYMQVDEFKSLVKDLHKNGVRIILDVVFNHTAEGNEHGPYISFKGIDNNYYYILTPEGYYYNFSGCGNTLNCNNPVVRRLILDCLRYWVATFHIDGFRFDLASILGRNQDGSPMSNPPLLESIAFDPVLKDVILIAEAWDAAGLYQVGNFPSYGRWAEWNGRYRDDVRRFLKGDGALVGAMAARILGSEDIYNRYWRGDAASVNFITCHDGFTLHDLYSYNYKHNEANGWENTDGSNDNFSWNCGVEGETDDKDVNFLRRKMIKNAAAVLFTSIGIPMILAGDEFGNSQSGNNNPYCQDNKISWLDWNDLKKNRDIYRFFKYMITFRKRHPILMRLSKGAPEGYPAVSLHGGYPWQFDGSPESRYIGVMFAGKKENGEDDFIYLGVNAHWEAKYIFLPGLPIGKEWKVEVNTDLGDKVCYETPCEITPKDSFLLGGRSVVICTA
ncbi:MAG: glycogen debranching protein GlgX [Selenomonadaceae bacterium]|nr:glycogen debranching protein GlgX [Selenomonadaceae bacterium]